MENNKNNIKDNMAISYFIKEILVELNKINGELPHLIWVKENLVELTHEEYTKVIQIMVEGGLITGCKIDRVDDENVGIFKLEKMRITLKGIEYLLTYYR